MTSRGLFLLTDYPAVSVRPGTTATVNLQLQNYALPPERLALSVAGVPSGWTSTLLGGGQPVAPCCRPPTPMFRSSFALDVPKDAPLGTTNLTVTAKGAHRHLTLPVAVTLVKDLPAKLTVNPQLPDLRGTSKSTFEYQLSIKNESGKKLLVAPLGAGAAEFQHLVHRAIRQPGIERASRSTPTSRRTSSSRSIRRTRSPPASTRCRSRRPPRTPTVTTELGLDVTGQPKLDISGRDGVLSTRASAGKEATVPIVVTNTGTAPAEQVELSGSGPSGWKINFNPKTIDRIRPTTPRKCRP